MHGFRGFSLIELLITVAILAILSALAVPAFGTMIRDNRLATGANTILGSLQLARSESIKRGEPVIVCPANSDGSACGSSGAWESGWLVFVDEGSNEDSYDDDDTLLRQRGAMDAGLTVVETGENPFDGNGYVLFDRNGALGQRKGGNLLVCDARDTCTADADKKHARSIQIQLSGLASIKRYDD